MPIRHPRGDRFGGVIFDIQEYRKGREIRGSRIGQSVALREQLIRIASRVIGYIEDIDEAELNSFNPRIGVNARRVIGCECGCGKVDGSCLFERG
jgi:hypothetical protein